MNKIIEEDINNIIKEDIPWEKLENKTILVTGANGFIPSYIVRTLLALKHTKVIALVRNKDRALKKFSDILNDKNLNIIVQDITLPFKIDEKIDYIIHAASQASPKYYGIDPVGTLKANSVGTSYLLDLAVKNNIEKFIFFSSGEIYGKINETTPQLREDYNGSLDCTDIRSCYGESKRMGENMCVCYSYQYGFDTNMIRLSHTYGPGISLDDGRVFADFVSNIINNKNIILNSDGSAKRCFCYITDMILGMFYVLFYGENQNAYNIATDKETSILELANTLTNLYPEKQLSVQLNKNLSPKGYIKSQSTRANFNIDKIKALGWEPKIDIKTGFKRMIESYNLITL